MQQVSILKQNNSGDDNDDKSAQSLQSAYVVLKQFLHSVCHATSESRLFTALDL